VPALAVAGALRAEGAEVAFIGGQRAEAELVPAAGYALHRIAVAGLDRRNPLRALRAVVLAVVAVVRCIALLRRLRVDAVLGGGGYVAGPVGLAAVLLRVPLVLTEADSHLGISNRLLARFARRVCLAFPIAGRTGRRYRVTGRPVPPPAVDRAAARDRFGIAEDETLVLVFGGSLGARSINTAAVEAFADAPFRVLHAAGERDFASLAAPREGYDLRPYVHEFGDALLAADLVVARAGGSLFEIAAHGRPAVLIPYPHATADHQSANARCRRDPRRRADPRAPRARGRHAPPRPRPPRRDGPRLRHPRPPRRRSRDRCRAARGGRTVMRARSYPSTGVRPARIGPLGRRGYGSSVNASTCCGRTTPKWRRSTVAISVTPSRSAAATTDASTVPSGRSW
jgi:UDP-N-acetylglucosamine--N-acetylmuramyl-(pentapeptide) pyrophosphoryl-undecaprenol N-acetylglucosamine transferase